ncbi:MAG: hypothetical protein ACKO9A_06955, partial [Alphaproteobacteria bacterium]
RARRDAGRVVVVPSPHRLTRAGGNGVRFSCRQGGKGADIFDYSLNKLPLYLMLELTQDVTENLILA